MLQAPLKIGTAEKQYPSTKRSRNLLSTSATAGSGTVNRGLDLRACIVFAHLKYNLAHDQAWLKNTATAS